MRKSLIDLSFFGLGASVPGCSVNIAPASDEPYAGSAEDADPRTTARGGEAAASSQATGPRDAAFIALRLFSYMQITIERRRLSLSLSLTPEIGECVLLV